MKMPDTKTNDFSKIESDEFEQSDCVSGYTKGICDCGTEIFLAQRCHREWCPTCGKNTVDDDEMGYLQSQRYSRTLPQAKWIYYECLPANSPNRHKNSVGQYVITFPDKIQGEIYRRQVQEGEAFTRIRNVVQDALNEENYDSILTAFHLQGDKNKSELWRPHFHLLVSDGFLGDQTLARIKKRVQMRVAKLLRKWTTKKIWSFQVIVNYNYVEDDKSKLKHLVRYFVRPTMTNRRKDREAINFYRWTYGRKRLQESGPLKNTTLIVPLGGVRGAINLTTCTEILCPECNSEITEWVWLTESDAFGEILANLRKKSPTYLLKSKK